jgi:hypothetical protein
MTISWFWTLIVSTAVSSTINAVVFSVVAHSVITAIKKEKSECLDCPSYRHWKNIKDGEKNGCSTGHGQSGSS